MPDKTLENNWGRQTSQVYIRHLDRGIYRQRRHQYIYAYTTNPRSASRLVLQLQMNAQAGPSRSQPPLHIDLGNIMVDQPHYTSPLPTSASSFAPSLSIHRSSTQSGFSWNGPQTPRTERLSLTSSEWSISEDDVVSFGRDAERSISSVMLDEGKTGGWWADLVSLSRC